jgi:photosystem II stability/assembly factor-like uncharacterized protein
MKTNTFLSTILLALLVSFSGMVYAQNWTLLNPKPTQVSLWDVDFPSPDTGYIVGDNSLLMRTIDGGETWENLEFPTPETQLRNINFINNNKGFIAYDNIIYTSHDAGETWEIVNVDILTGLWETYFYNDTIGFAFGYYCAIAKTVDGGESWEKLNFSIAQDHVYDAIGFANEQTGYVVGRKDFVGNEPICRRTDDGGETWVDIEVPEQIEFIKGLSVLGPDELWIGAGNGIYNPDTMGVEALLFKTDDGGDNWTEHVIGISNSGHAIEDIEFINPNEGRVLNSNHFYTTSDGGENWTDTYTHGTEDQFWLFNTFSCIDAQTTIFVGQGPTIVKTTDMGQNFTSLVEGSTNSCDNIFFSDSINGCVGSFGPIPPTQQLFYTEDGGDSWQKAVIDTMAHQTRIFDLDFSTPEIGWASGRGSTPYKTNDGGRTWAYTPTGFDFWFKEISTPDAEHIFMAGWNAEVIKSEDGGTTWVDVSPDVQFQLSDGGFVFADNEVGYMALSDQNYNHGKLLKTLDGGMNWTEIDYGYNILLECMGFANAEVGLIGLDNEKLLVTNDGGATWVESEIDAPSSIKYVKMFDTNIAVAAVEGDFVAVSNDGGLTFETMFSGPYTWPTLVHDYHFITENKGWVSGKNGMIMRYDATTTGIEPFGQNPNEIAPENIFFPNPSNGEINILIPDYTSLTIVDMNGKVVKAFDKNIGNRVDVSGLKPGLYVVTVYSETSSQQQKLLKY